MTAQYRLLTKLEAGNLAKFAELNGNTILISKDSPIGQSHRVMRQDDYFRAVNLGINLNIIGEDITDYDSY
jgi:hypothetical protein